MIPLLLMALSLQPGTDPEPTAQVVHLASKHRVIVTAGPFTVHSMPPGMKHEEMDMMEDHNTPVYRFDWPVEGWVRGFGVEILDAAGRPIDRRLVHHMIVVNFSRRQLLYAAFERLFGIGQETQDAAVPKTVGVPLTPGTKLGFYMAWANETGKDLDGVQVRLTMTYSPPNLQPRPLDALPIYMDANLTVGVGNDFDVPPGRSEKAWEFRPPVGGRLLGVGGHLHDYGVEVRLEDGITGKVLTRIRSKRTPDGKVLRIERRLFGVTGPGLRLKEGHPYRVVGVYDNPTGALIRKGAMAHLVGLYVPDDYSRWPRLDLSDPTLQDDLAFLTEMGGGGGHKHH
jgi:hypothetical protein